MPVTDNIPDDGKYVSAVAVWTSVAAPVLLLLGTNARYRATADELVVAVTFVAEEAFPASAPLNNPAVTVPTVSISVDGTYERFVAV
jgi:hypothetical protein